MSRSQGKRGRFIGANGFASGASTFGGFSSSSGGSGLSYLTEPPDFSTISDANVGVSFKNLLKKDATTKTKALEDLVAYVQTHPHEQGGGAEDAILDVWVQLYPRISIDNARRVRELSHTLQFELMRSARKRMEKRVPKVVGAWLAGLYDRDRAVSRAANDGLSSFLNTHDKVVQFWKKCQSQILTYATDAMQETKDTLSDERSTTADDADAKYFRVVGGSLSLALGLLQKLEQSDLDSEADAYDAFFSEDKVWKSATFADPNVRKASCQLLWICIDRRPESVASQLSRIKKIFISEGLKCSQVGSATEYIRVLTRLTNKHSEIWSSSGEKKPPVSRLCGFLRKGSQAGSAKFWEYLEHLLLSIPRDNIPDGGPSEIMESFRTGITNREEPRMNAPIAWASYIRTAKHLMGTLAAGDCRTTFVRDHVSPLTAHYLHPTPETIRWDIGGAGKLAVLVEVFNACTDKHLDDVSNATVEEWKNLSSAFCTRVSSSAPGEPKDYAKLQEDLSEEGSRWFTLVGQIHTKSLAAHQKTSAVLESPCRDIILTSIRLLAARNLEPFGAAGVLCSVGKGAPHIWEDEATAAELETFLLEQGRERMDVVIPSRAATSLFGCLAALGTLPSRRETYKKIWNAWLSSLLPRHDQAAALDGIRSLVSHPSASELAAQNDELQNLIGTKVEQSIRGTAEAWALLETALSNDALSDSVAKRIAEEALSALAQDTQKASNALRVLEILTNNKPEILSQDDTVHVALITALLSLTELSGTDLSSRAQSLRAILDDRADGKQTAVAIIQKNLGDASTHSLGIDTLSQQALQALAAGAASAQDLFPNTNIWMEQLQLFLHSDINPSLSITSNVGGAQALVPPEEGDAPSRFRRDRDGRSIPARMAMYASKLLSSGIDTQSLPRPLLIEVLFLLCVSVHLASDQIALMEENKLWGSLNHKNSLTEASDFVSETRASIETLVATAVGWRDGSDTGSSGLIEDLISLMMKQTQTLTPMGLYSSRALGELIESLTEKHGAPLAIDEKLSELDTMKASPSTILGAVALVSGFGATLRSSKLVNTLANRLVSDIAGLGAQADKTLPTLVLLNRCAGIYETGELPVANNRLVFAVRQITSWLEDPIGLSPALSAEICRALQKILPCIKGVYGPHWERTLEFCTTLWTDASDDETDDAIPYIHASLKLFTTLESLADPNDDLEDALKEVAEAKSRALLKLLELHRERSTQPIQIVDAIICRQVEKVPLAHLGDLSDLYHLVASEARDIQTAAFDLLHRALPASQEQLSVDVLLEKKDARLPDELVSLLLDAPTLEKYPDDVLAQFPTSIRSYLLSWHLIFDAYSTASVKVRNDYTEHLKSENSVGPLLQFTFDVLGHSAAHALSLDREGLTADHIRSYDFRVADAEADERNLQWFLVHIYYLVLKYVPGLFRGWFIECRSKQTKTAVEWWMTKYFSPIIISEVLSEVASWAASQGHPGDEEKELMVKVSQAGREITAGYEVDESLASIAIRVPQGYPLEGVTVVGINRVAVNERKWQSWLMTTQGVITFSNGSIIDGLTTFRRNIVGALKGQTECAICYSIISADRKMPDKKCQTCRNSFHRTCLYKWFQSSGQNTCPLCRNPIDYLGADVKARRAAAA
ncbi:hypothetical protein SODALDRAFT_28970 [Sodiomyces alkalinus F11]|uniref:E3 ubiquitin-protein ligase listerin n=1 Tax=Sodiomyces alkalinus (strain CBS 110278 / VKM F-3762 / F11) TaxID=1314773 RepID=A0A3N2Q8G0_SODAK|nr:hypothetical protein SODALDRAFT_28970 [Sodiomyces alkalinus F11]ROT43030.1 hypothetical protein SODALDRAFT_28970 [Sodiomyces alkalinus F11]